MLGQAEGSYPKGLAFVVLAFATLSASAKSVDVVVSALLGTVDLLCELATGLVVDEIADLIDALGDLVWVLLCEFLCLAT